MVGKMYIAPLPTGWDLEQLNEECLAILDRIKKAPPQDALDLRAEFNDLMRRYIHYGGSKNHLAVTHRMIMKAVRKRFAQTGRRKWREILNSQVPEPNFFFDQSRSLTVEDVQLGALWIKAAVGASLLFWSDLNTTQEKFEQEIKDRIVKLMLHGAEFGSGQSITLTLPSREMQVLAAFGVNEITLHKELLWRLIAYARW